MSVSSVHWRDNWFSICTCTVAWLSTRCLLVSTSEYWLHAVGKMRITWYFTYMSGSFCLYCLNDAYPFSGLFSLMLKHRGFFTNILRVHRWRSLYAIISLNNPCPQMMPWQQCYFSYLLCQIEKYIEELSQHWSIETLAFR